MPEQKDENKRVEIRALDAHAWAYVNLPVGLFAGLLAALLYPTASQEQLLIWVGAPIAGMLLFWIGAWLQATSINLLIRFLNAGPILTIRILDHNKDAEQTTQPKAMNK